MDPIEIPDDQAAPPTLARAPGWAQCPLVEVIPGKVGGAALLKNTRLPVEAITGNYDSFRDEGLSHEAALAETVDCYPQAGLEAIETLLAYRTG